MLKVVQDIPETHLVKLIKAVVSKQNADETGVWAERVPAYLQFVIDSPQNEIFMQQALKHLAVSELQPILSAFVGWLDVDDGDDAAALKYMDTNVSRLEDKRRTFCLILL